MGVGHLEGARVIHYHGMPVTPETAAYVVADAGHAFVPYPDRRNLPLVLQVCQSFAVDNGAFSAWRKGQAVRDWSGFYEWAAEVCRYPSFDFAVIPDVIDGTEADNDALVREWPLPRWAGAPVWHMHESLTRLIRLVHEWPRVCLGSSGQYAAVGSPDWWLRIESAMAVCCDADGLPFAKLHGLRMLNPKVFTRLPLASADSTNVARNIGIDGRWTGSYPPATKEAKAAVLRGRIEKFNAATFWRSQR